MSVTAKRKITIVYSGDVGGTQEIEASDNTVSPGQIQYLELGPGVNTIDVPGTANGVTIMKPSDNTTALYFYGIDPGNTPWRLHDTDPDSFTFRSITTLAIENTGLETVYLRLFWT